MSVSQITRWRCSDNKEFNTEAEAEAHEVEITLTKKLRKHIEDYIWDRMDVSEMAEELVKDAEWLKEKRENIVSILKGDK